MTFTSRKCIILRPNICTHPLTPHPGPPAHTHTTETKFQKTEWHSLTSSTPLYFVKNESHDPKRVLKCSLEIQLYYTTIYSEGRYPKQDTDGCRLTITKAREPDMSSNPYSTPKEICDPASHLAPSWSQHCEDWARQRTQSSRPTTCIMNRLFSSSHTNALSLCCQFKVAFIKAKVELFWNGKRSRNWRLKYHPILKKLSLSQVSLSEFPD